MAAKSSDRFNGIMVLGEEVFVGGIVNRVMEKYSGNGYRLLGNILKLYNEFKLPPVPVSTTPTPSSATDATFAENGNFCVAMDLKA